MLSRTGFSLFHRFCFEVFDRFYFRRRRTVDKFEFQPFAKDLFRKLDADDSLAEADDVAVVGQGKSLAGEAVMADARTDPLELDRKSVM